MSTIKINPKKLNDLIENLRSYTKDLIKKNDDLSDIKRGMDRAWEDDSQYMDVGGPALTRMIENNEDVIKLLNDTLDDLEIWRDAVAEYEKQRGNGMI